MSLKAQIEQDIKTALLSGDKSLTTTLRGLKSAILYVEVAHNKRESGLSDEEVIDVLTKEAKKRQESANLYKQGGSDSRAEQELAELGVIKKYLPEQLSDNELTEIVDKILLENSASSQQMGVIIGQVKQATNGRADGGRIANIVKQRME